MNASVSFELAKSLKEKGFDKSTSKYFKYDGKECENITNKQNIVKDEKHTV